MQTAEVVPTPWWRRLLQFFQRRARPLGSRPSRFKVRTLRGIVAALRRVLIVALLLLGLFYVIFPSMRTVVNAQVLALKDRVEALFVPKYMAVRPAQVTATAELPDHPAGLATDLNTQSFWVAPDAATRPALVLEFDRPTQLARAIVHNGWEDDFLAWGRPRELHLVYSTGATANVILEDKPTKQEVDFGDGDGATRVEIHVVSVYESVQNPGLALSEIELFERQ